MTKQIIYKKWKSPNYYNDRNHVEVWPEFYWAPFLNKPLISGKTGTVDLDKDDGLWSMDLLDQELYRSVHHDDQTD